MVKVRARLLIQLLVQKDWRMSINTVAYSIATFFDGIFLCTPVSSFWDKHVAKTHCSDQVGLFVTNGLLNIMQNFAILILPMPVVCKLSVPKAQKRVLIGFFMLGGL